MKITKKELKKIIKEELAHVMEEGRLRDAQRKIPRNTGNVFLDAFHTLEYLSGPDASLVRWIQNADGKAKEGNKEAARALEVVKAAFSKERELSENVTGLPVEDEVMGYYRDGIDPHATAEKLSLTYDRMEIEKLKEKFEFGDWKGDFNARFLIFILDILDKMRY